MSIKKEYFFSEGFFKSMMMYAGDAYDTDLSAPNGNVFDSYLKNTRNVVYTTDNGVHVRIWFDQYTAGVQVGDPECKNGIHLIGPRESGIDAVMDFYNTMIGPSRKDCRYLVSSVAEESEGETTHIFVPKNYAFDPIGEVVMTSAESMLSIITIDKYIPHVVAHKRSALCGTKTELIYYEMHEVRYGINVYDMVYLGFPCNCNDDAGMQQYHKLKSIHRTFEESSDWVDVTSGYRMS